MTPGVGTFAVQIAKAFGADVTGVCSTTKVDMTRSIGADHVQFIVEFRLIGSPRAAQTRTAVRSGPRHHEARPPSRDMPAMRRAPPVGFQNSAVRVDLRF